MDYGSGYLIVVVLWFLWELVWSLHTEPELWERHPVTRSKSSSALMTWCFNTLTSSGKGMTVMSYLVFHMCSKRCTTFLAASSNSVFT